MNGKLPQEIFDRFADEMQSLKSRLQVVCTEHGANFSDKFKKLADRPLTGARSTSAVGTFPADDDDSDEGEAMNGKIPTVEFDKFVEEYSKIREDFNDSTSDLEATIPMKQTVTLAIEGDSDDEDAGITIEESYSNDDDDFDMQTLLQNCPKAKEAVDKYKSQMQDFKSRLQELCNKHGADFEEKFEKIQDRAE